MPPLDLCIAPNSNKVATTVELEELIEMAASNSHEFNVKHYLTIVDFHLKIMIKVKVVIYARFMFETKQEIC